MKRKHCTNINKWHTHFSKNIKSHYPSLHLHVLLSGDFPSTTSTHTLKKKKNFASLIASFSFFSPSIEEKLVKKRMKIYFYTMEDKPILFCQILIRACNYFLISLLLPFWFDLFLYIRRRRRRFHFAVPRGFSRAHRTKSDHSGFSRAGGSNDFHSSHHGIFPLFYFF